MATRALSGSGERPGANNASSTHSVVGLPSTIRFRDASIAISQVGIGATLTLPPPAARAIVWRASAESGWVPAASQSQMCVSSKTGRGSDVLLIARPFLVERTDDVADDLDRPGHIAEQVDRFVVDRHQLGHRLAAFGDGDRRAAPRDSVPPAPA